MNINITTVISDSIRYYRMFSHMSKYIPSKNAIQNSNIYKMMQELSMDSYEEFWKWSVQNKIEFWEQTVDNLGIQFDEKYSSIVNVDEGVENAKWLYESKLNITDSCFQNDDNAVVIVFQEEGGTLQKVTQKEPLFTNV